MQVHLSNCYKVEQMRKARGWPKTNKKDADLIPICRDCRLRRPTGGRSGARRARFAIVVNRCGSAAKDESFWHSFV